MKRFQFIYFPFYLTFLFCSTIFSQTDYRLPGFQNSQYFDEQILNISYEPEVIIHINAPSSKLFNPDKPVCLALFALPNGNTTEQTIGKVVEPGDDWHFDIPHIGAQTRFIRENIPDYNLVTVYLENNLKSWPAWKARYSNHHQLVSSIVDSMRNIFSKFENFVVLTSHSGGGRFTFSFMDGYDEIPDFVKRISFLDSNYGYDHNYGSKLVKWLNSSEDKFLSVLAYNDSIALYNGQPIVSDTGGTWVRSKMMREFMSEYYEFSTVEDEELITSEALDKRIQILLKKNPERKILHTVQVELNGFIQSMTSGTDYEGVNYEYYGDRAYSQWIQKEFDGPAPLNIPPRPPDAMTGSEFMQSVTNLSFEQREERILKEITNGNIPGFLRTLTKIKTNYNDANGTAHSVIFEVMPDYLAIGSDVDFCRIPMGPVTAQKLADIFGASMPTRKLVDKIYRESDVKLSPVTFDPNVYQIDRVPIFIEHNTAIEDQRRAENARLGQLVGGIKKDVVISNKITDPNRTHHVVIYGWHKLDGNPIQPLTNIHIDSYTDYSHGIRFINSQMLIDSNLVDYKDILTDEVLCKILSDESGAMERASYLKVSGLPEKPNSFGVINNGANELRIVLEPDDNIEYYNYYLSSDGINFTFSGTLPRDDLIIDGLDEDSLYFIKLKSVNQIGESGFSEVLGAVPSADVSKSTVIINGFDRSTDGNTRDFIRQHGMAFFYNGAKFNSATNEAVIDGLINLKDYSVANYILGEESTADETFNSTEQSLIKDYLMNGGNLFISGSEIAWDLDYKGNSSDKSFFHNFLKMKYVADAPYNSSSTYYQAQLISNDFIADIPSFYFDDGSHETYNVKWPDVFLGNAGGIEYISYSGLNASTGCAGVLYEGMFPDGEESGKVITLGFPFETIYREDIRNMFIGQVLKFFDIPTFIETSNAIPIPDNFKLLQNYPNPFNPSTTIKYSIPFVDRMASFDQVNNIEVSQSGDWLYNVTLKVYDVLGKEVATLVNEHQPPGNYSIQFDGYSLSSGIYFYTLQAGKFMDSKKMVLLR